MANTRLTCIGVNFQHAKGTFCLEVNQDLSAAAFGLYGRSGSGKSTLLKVIAGIEQPDRGFIRIADNVLFDSSRKINIPRSQRNIGYVPQIEGRIDPRLTVKDIIMEGQQKAGPEDGPKHPKYVIEILDLSPLLHCRVGELLRGDHRRVELARALIPTPKLLLFDEPVVELDHRRRSLLPYLQRVMTGMGIPVIYVSHNIYEIQALAELIVVLDRGRVLRVCSPHELPIEALNDPNKAVKLAAIRAVGALGPEVWNLAQPAVTRLAVDPAEDKDVRTAANHALRNNPEQ